MFLTGFLAAQGGSAYDGMSDEALLLASARGDREAFRRLYENTDKAIYGYILSLTKSSCFCVCFARALNISFESHKSRNLFIS